MFEHLQFPLTPLEILGRIVIGMPVLLLVVLGLPFLFGKPLSERWIGRIVPAGMILGLLASLGVLGFMLAQRRFMVNIDLGHWVTLPHFHFSLKFVFDRLSVPMCILTFVLCGTIGAFANKYLHREQGFARFFMQY